jgi:hypothetical protein
MLRTLILVSTFILPLTAFASEEANTLSGSLQWSAGMAVEGRVQKDVNPDYYDGRALGQLFARARLAPWSGLLELGEERRQTSSGNLSITTLTRHLGLWARGEPWMERGWSPYFGLGTGVFLDRVETSFVSDRSVDRGQRFFIGAAMGISRTVWKRCLLELEGRVQAIEQVQDPVFSGILRVGYIF